MNYKKHVLYMVSLRGFRSAFYDNKEEAEKLYCYLNKNFAGASLVKTDYRRVMKNLYLMRNC